jgi:hypothetical protein
MNIDVGAVPAFELAVLSDIWNGSEQMLAIGTVRSKIADL